MTVREFLELCTQDWIEVEFFNCDTEESITEPIEYVRDYGDHEDIAEAEIMSWDIDNGKLCINYSI